MLPSWERKSCLQGWCFLGRGWWAVDLQSLVCLQDEGSNSLSCYRKAGGSWVGAARKGS